MMKKNLINPLRALALFVVVIGLVFTTSCGDDEEDEPAPTQTTLEIIASNENFSEFETFYELNSDLLPDISGTSEFTVFAPNNNAFAKLKATLDVDDLTAIKAEVIASVLAFHFVSGTTSELTANSSLSTAQGESIVVGADGTIQTGGSDDMVEVLGSTKATNGIVYETETILIPPTIYASIVTHLGKVSQTLLLGGDFSILARAIVKADTYAAGTAGQVTPLSTYLSTDGIDVTIFAPTDATFKSAAGVTATDDAATVEAKIQGFLDLYTGQQFYGIIANHVVTKLVVDADLVTGAALPTAFTLDGQTYGSLTVFNNTSAIPADNGIGVYLDANGDVDLADQTTYGNFDAEVVLSPTVTGLTAANGSIYIIAGVLSPL